MRFAAGSRAEPDAAPPPAAGSPRRRLAWTVADQALSSATNIGTAVVAARSLGRQEFGAFGLAFAVYLLALGTSRALVTEPLLSRHSRTAMSQVGPPARQVVGAAAGVGVVWALVLLGASPLVGGPAGQALWSLAVVIVGLVVQDAWRYWFVAAGRPSSAFSTDGVWCATQLALLVPMASAGAFTLVTVVMWWGLSGTLAGVAVCLAKRTLPALSAASGWIGAHRDLGVRYGADFLTASGAMQATVLGLGAIAGLGALGAFRAAQVYFGPINVFFGGMYLALVPEGARVSTHPRRLRRLMALASAVLVVMSASWLVAGLLLPGQVGRALLGASWDGGRSLLVPVGAAVLGGAVAGGGMAGLRALGAARATLRARLLGLPLMIAAPLVGATAGARGFALGLAFATWVGAVVWWWAFERALRVRSGPSDVVPKITAPGGA